MCGSSPPDARVCVCVDMCVSILISGRVGHLLLMPMCVDMCIHPHQWTYGLFPADAH